VHDGTCFTLKPFRVTMTPPTGVPDDIRDWFVSQLREKFSEQEKRMALAYVPQAKGGSRLTMTDTPLPSSRAAAMDLELSALMRCYNRLANAERRAYQRNANGYYEWCMIQCDDFHYALCVWCLHVARGENGLMNMAPLRGGMTDATAYQAAGDYLYNTHAGTGIKHIDKESWRTRLRAYWEELNGRSAERAAEYRAKLKRGAPAQGEPAAAAPAAAAVAAAAAPAAAPARAAPAAAAAARAAPAAAAAARAAPAAAAAARAAPAAARAAGRGPQVDLGALVDAFGDEDEAPATKAPGHAKRRQRGG
jgi:hypothetical protein